MKKNNVSLSLLIGLIASINYLNAQNDVWKRIQPTPQEHNLNCIRQIPGTDKLVAVGDAATIMYTEDEGETWDITLNPAGLPNGTKFLSVNFYDEQNGFAAANYGRIIHTTDGGDSWKMVYDNLHDSLQTNKVGIYLFDAETAIIVGYNRLILKTENSGESWTTLLSPDGFFPNSIDFVNQDTGYIVGKTDTAIILKTENGGNSWQNRSLNIENINNYYDIKFINDSTGIISSTNNDAAFLYKSNDGGITWSLKYTSANYYDVGEIGFKDDLNGAIRIYSWVDSFLYTQDGGETWVRDQDYFFSNSSPCLSFIYEPSYMIGVGYYGKIGRKSPGEEWENLSDNINFAKCRNAQFTSGQIGYALYSARGGGGVPSGYLLKSTDGGHNWYNIFGAYKGSFDFLTDNYGFVAKNNLNVNELYIYKTTNGGNSWNNVYNFGEVDLYWDQPVTITFQDSLNGIIAYLAKSYITNNAGSSWQDLLMLQMDIDEIHSVDYLSNDTIFMSGRVMFYPTVIRSFDGGETFDIDTIDLHNYIAEHIYFINNTTGFILVNKFEDDSGFIYKTIDAGETWYPTIINDTNESSYQSVYFPTDDIGYAVGYGDYTTIIKTTDGGETWDPIDIPCSSGLTHVYFQDEWHGFIFGDNGVIMETLTGGVVDIPEIPSGENKPFFTLSPNPVKDQLKINFIDKITGIIQADIYNLNGEKVSSDRIYDTNNKPNIYNVSGLPSGIYFVKISNNIKVQSSKFVKL